MVRLQAVAALALGAAALLPAVAAAQDVFPYDLDGDGAADVILPPDAWPEWATRGTGSPTVVYDEDADRWVMHFEARLSEDFLDTQAGDFEDCRAREGGPRVVWGIGRATSTDGLSGWTIDSQPVIVPDGSWKSCSVSHPWVMVSEGEWHLYFKAEQGFAPCASGEEPPWGCGRMTGVGYATTTNAGASWSVVDSAEPMLTVTDFGFPTVVTTQGTGEPEDAQKWRMLLTRPDGLYLATSDRPDGGWTLSPGNPVLEPGTWSFAEDEWFQPALVCNDEGESFAFSAWIGGSTEGGTSGFALVRSVDAASWVGTGVPVVEWEGEPLWRHWDVVKIGDEGYVYYTTFNDANQVEVRLLKVGESADFFLDPAGWGGRSCLYGDRGPQDTDTGDPGDTDDTDPWDTDPWDTDTPGDGEGCYCNSSALPLTALPLLVGMGLVGLLRRRERQD